MIVPVSAIKKLLEETNDPELKAVLDSHEFLREELRHAGEMADERKKLYHKSQVRITELN